MSVCRCFTLRMCHSFCSKRTHSVVREHILCRCLCCACIYTLSTRKSLFKPTSQKASFQKCQSRLVPLHQELVAPMFENHTGLSRTVSSWWLLLGLPGLGVAAASSPSTLSFPPGLFIWRAVLPPRFFPRTVNLHLSPLPAAR